MPDKWPDIHVPGLTGTPLIRIAGDDISITNSILTMWLVMAVILVVAWLATRRLGLVPGSRQSLVELFVQGISDFVEGTGGRPALKYRDLFGSLFLFLVLSNWLSVVPFVGQVEVLRAPTSDYHINFGLAVMAFIAYQAEGIRTHGTKYFGKFINTSGFREGLFLGAIMLFVGLIELFAELFRMLTLTLRLWGNVLGGEIMLGVIAAVLYVVAVPGALPFIGLEVFIGLIQGLIFSLLVLMYFILAIEHHDDAHAQPESAPKGDGIHKPAPGMKREGAHA